jgi:U3 small nucleolar RNA-associated protein 18
MNGTLRSAAYSSDSRYLFTSGGDGEIYQWDMGSRKCVHRFQDEGCLSNTALAVSPNGRFLASGARSGVVNLYDVNALAG